MHYGLLCGAHSKTQWPDNSAPNMLPAPAEKYYVDSLLADEYSNYVSNHLAAQTRSTIQVYIQ
jgi:hypothetical protein